MRNFELYLYDKNKKILLTSFDEQSKTSFSPASTFNEQLQEQENDQYTLTFSIAKYVSPNELNGFINKIYFGSKLKLIMDYGETDIDLIINSIQPTIYTHNIIYKISAEDEISWSWARRNLGYSYSNSEVKEDGTITGVENIYTITRKVLSDCGLSRLWSIDDDIFSPLYNKKIILNVEDSNPYNVLIEACNSVGAYLKKDYKNHKLKYYKKDSIGFSGYRYFPQTNLKSFSVNGSIDNFVSILHVFGGTNEKEEIISLVPPIPDLLSRWIKTIGGIDAFLSSTGYRLSDNSINWSKIENEILASSNPYIDNGDDEESKKVANEIYNEEKAKLNQFISIATRVPHLGQFFYDFSYFEKTNQISEENKNEIMTAFNSSMLKYNLYLRLYEPQYYNLKWEIMSWESKFQTAAEEYVVLWQQLLQSTNNTTLDNIVNDFNNLENTLISYIQENNYAYFRNLASLGYDYSKYSAVRMDKQMGIYNDLYSEKEKELSKLKVKRNKIKTVENVFNYEAVQLDEQIAYIEQLLDTYKTLAGSNWKDMNGKRIIPLYEYMKNILTKNVPTDNFLVTSDGVILQDRDGNYLESTEISPIRLPNPDDNTKSFSLEELINYCNNRVKSIWNNLYFNYSQYFIEGKYENSDELDSVSLFNQAVIYHDNLNRPEISYNIAVLDIAALEQIDIPRVKVGAKIKVYNEMLNYADEEENLLDYRDNSLIITGITTTLRTPGSVSLTVSRQQWYKGIVEKLLKTVQY